MNFEWDEAKRRRTLAERQLDFASAYRFFDGRPIVTAPTRRGQEMRWKTIAMIEGACFTLVWTWRGENIRVISLRKAHDGEERAHRELHG